HLIRWLVEKHELLSRVNCVAEIVEMLLGHPSVASLPAAVSDLRRIRAAAEKWRSVIEEVFSPGLAKEAEHPEFRRRLDHRLREPLCIIIGYADYLARHAAKLGLQTIVPDLKQLTALGNQSLQMTDEIVYRIRRAVAGEANLPDSLKAPLAEL